MGGISLPVLYLDYVFGDLGQDRSEATLVGSYII